MDLVMRRIGEIHSPFIDKRETPIQPSRSSARGQVEVDPAYADGPRDLNGFSHIILLYAFHRSDGYTLLVKPFLDDQERGLFATRYPARPNPIGLSIVRLLAVHDHILEIDGVEKIQVQDNEFEVKYLINKRNPDLNLFPGESECL
ncbi:MAG: SAM-dependent methyltransferase [Chloroflexi bacterium]|nr:SAM-dependent methyltransferase [Chloroflexota bacterium]